MAIEHKDITGANLHEPKGVAAASANTLYVANGSGSGTWAKADAASIKSTGKNQGQILIADGSGGSTWDGSVWKDLIGHVSPKATGAGAPTRTLYRGNIYDFAFAVNDQVDFSFHMPHDYKPGTDLYLHTHWSHNGTNISGTLTSTFYISYAKGHNQVVWPAEVVPTLTDSSLSLVAAPQYRHMLTEVQLSATSPSATQIDTDDLEPDGIILATMKVTSLPTVTGGSLFIHFADLHYKACYLGTVNKAPTFYS